MKPMLCSNYEESKLVFPLIAQPKIDGCRGLNMDGQLTGRSLKPFKNIYTTAFYSRPEYVGLDGELTAASEIDPALCRLTTSALNTIEGKPFTLWYVFDLLNEETVGLPYLTRYQTLYGYIYRMQKAGFCGHLRIIPMNICRDLQELLDLDSKWLDQGYEGTIIRSLNGQHKQGRSTVKEGGLLRIKRFIEEEALVLEIIEGQINLNDAQTNELGHTFRTSHQENQTANGLIGSLRCKDLKTDQEIIVSAGSMTHDLRKYYFNNSTKIIGRIIKYKHFPKGVKNLPRFPTYQCHRANEDIS